MSKLWIVFQGMCAYLRTVKGRHDFLDYMRALLLIILTILTMMALVAYFSGLH